MIDGLHRTMEKIHRDRDIEIEVKIAEPLKFRGERQDLEEMVGNLVDNACKWAQSQVHVEVLAERRSADDPMPMVRIIVDDDGRGLTADERVQVARRGRRLDETKPGSGLGLSIVTDLAQALSRQPDARRGAGRRIAGGAAAAGGVAARVAELHTVSCILPPKLRPIPSALVAGCGFSGLESHRRDHVELFAGGGSWSRQPWRWRDAPAIPTGQVRARGPEPRWVR